MPVPKRKTSKTRRDKRRTHQKLSPTHFSVCPTTGVQHVRHQAFWEGDTLYYNGEKVCQRSTKDK